MIRPQPLDYLHTVPVQQTGQAIYTTTCGENMKPRTPEQQAGLALCPWCQCHTRFGK